MESKTKQRRTYVVEYSTADGRHFQLWTMAYDEKEAESNARRVEKETIRIEKTTPCRRTEN